MRGLQAEQLQAPLPGPGGAQGRHSQPAGAVPVAGRGIPSSGVVGQPDPLLQREALLHGHMAAVLGTLKQLGLHTLIRPRCQAPARPRPRPRRRPRVIDTQSKLATARALAPDSAVSTLGEMLGLGDVDQHELYAAMDWLSASGRPASINAPAPAGTHPRALRPHHELRWKAPTARWPARAPARDGKKGTLQIVFGLLCTAEGCPVAVAVFRGLDERPQDGGQPGRQAPHLLRPAAVFETADQRVSQTKVCDTAA